MKKQTAILNPKTVNQYIDLHKKLKIPFTQTISTYTTRIQSSYCDIHFMKTEHPKRVFCAYNKVKADVKKVDVRKIKTNSLQYYSANFKHDNFYADVIYNIDIKSAYATILFNDGLISKETFDYLNKLPKMERLASVGMLASKKNIFQIDEKGEVIDEKVIISPTSDYFFYCVKRTSEIVNLAAKHLGKAFLFSWVDGIYFLQDHFSSIKAGHILTEYFNKQNLNTQFEILTDFEVISHNDFYQCNFVKEGKKKFINVPKPEYKTMKKITEYLLTKNYN